MEFRAWLDEIGAYVERLRHKIRRKNGKDHRYWSLAENQRCAGGRTLQRQVLYLGEINDSQRAAWIKQIEVFDAQARGYTTTALFPEDRLVPAEVARPSMFGSVSSRFSGPGNGERVGWRCGYGSRWNWTSFGGDGSYPVAKARGWDLILAAMTAYRLIEPGSEWRLHRHWFGTTALGDLLGPEFSLGSKDNLYRCLDSLLKYKGELFSHLRQRWADLFAGQVRRVALRFNQHVFRERPALGPRGQAPFRPQSGQAFGLCAGGFSAGVDAGRLPDRLRSAARQHRRHHHARDFRKRSRNSMGRWSGSG